MTKYPCCPPLHVVSTDAAFSAANLWMALIFLHVGSPSCFWKCWIRETFYMLFNCLIYHVCDVWGGDYYFQKRWIILVITINICAYECYLMLLWQMLLLILWELFIMHNVTGENYDVILIAVRDIVCITCMWRNMDVTYKQHCSCKDSMYRFAYLQK